MLANDLKVIDGASAGAWIKPRLEGEFGAVTLQVPEGFEAYARIFHSARDLNQNPVSWAKVAKACGTTAHRDASSAAGPFCSQPSIGVHEGAPAVKARLGINKKTVGPGGALRVRIEDLGTSDLVYDLGYELARRRAESWVKLPPRPVFAPRLDVSAGTASACQGIDIPRHAPSGLYRVRKWVEPVVSRHHQRIAIKATFRVAGSGRANIPN